MRLAAAVALVVGVTPAMAFQTAAQLKQAVIRASIETYPGPCPCPYSVMRNGRPCGARSAYSRPGGYAPLCYPADVGAAEIEAYRQAQRAKR